MERFIIILKKLSSLGIWPFLKTHDGEMHSQEKYVTLREESVTLKLDFIKLTEI